MQFKALLALFHLVPITALGFVVPEGTPNGFYEVIVGDDGNTTTVEIDPSTHAVIGEPLENRSLPGRSAKLRRQVNSWGATGRTFPNQADYNACTQGWKNFFNAGSHVPSRTQYFAVSGQAVLAGCNYKYAEVNHGASLVDSFNGFMDGNAGWWRTGWVHFFYHSGTLFPTIDFTFWRDLSGTNFCDNLT
ncbi:hypothetical protein QC761_602295 [Podospora bellae-mahoneyi]|uniref:Ecp2 effector protein domain-containing protein n=1 Tax=Podospora bellae-mahoneyi TaxID=2093777 RepID=A0ABR0FCN0_9PEZI|nr:hypothetical protein QC761_602295 [Podospora bellae-mahoneyi]